MNNSKEYRNSLITLLREYLHSVQSSQEEYSEMILRGFQEIAENQRLRTETLHKLIRDVLKRLEEMENG